MTMGADESKTQIQVQNKDYDPAKLHRDKRAGEPMFRKLDEYPDPQSQGKFPRSPHHRQHRQDVNADDRQSSMNITDLEQVSMTQVNI